MESSGGLGHGFNDATMGEKFAIPNAICVEIFTSRKRYRFQELVRKKLDVRGLLLYIFLNLSERSSSHVRI